MKVANVLMDAPVYVLIELRKGIVAHVRAGYNEQELMDAGADIGRAGFNEGYDDIVVWESHPDPNKSCQVWHYEEGM